MSSHPETPDIAGAYALVRQVFDLTTSDEVDQWILDHRDELDERFFTAIDDFELTNPIVSDTIRNLTDYIRSFIEAYDQSRLANYILDAHTRLEYNQRLKEILSQIHSSFFHFLAEWAGDNNRNNDLGIQICEDLLRQIEFNDLREDWSDLERIIIWGASWFVHRGDKLGSLFDVDKSTEYIDGLFLIDAIRVAGNLRAHADMGLIALGDLNVILSYSERALVGDPPVSFAPMVRMNVLGNAISNISHVSHPSTNPNVRRLIGEYQVLMQQVTRDWPHDETFLTFKANEAAVLNTLGGLELEAGRPEEAFRLHLQSFRDHQKVVQEANEMRVSEESIRKYETGVTNSLRMLAHTEIELWHLDEASQHFEQVIGEYRRLGIQPDDLVTNLEYYAMTEFLRTHFARAEEILAEARKVRMGLGK